MAGGAGNPLEKTQSLDVGKNGYVAPGEREKGESEVGVGIRSREEERKKGQGKKHRKREMYSTRRIIRVSDISRRFKDAGGRTIVSITVAD